MSAASPKSSPTTCEDSTNATSSPVLAAGVLRSGLPDGPTIDLFGRVAAPVSRSVPPGSKKAGPTVAISGRIGRGSSESAALQRSLESRLRQRLPTGGSMLFSMTWKAMVTPAGRYLSRLAASARFIDGTACGSWRSPAAQNADRGGQDATERIAGGHTVNLQDQVTMVSWPTPNTPSGGRSMDPEKMDATGRTLEGRKHTASLEHAVKFTAWATPASRDYKDSPGMATTATNPDGSTRDRTDQLPRQAHGVMSSGSPAETGKPGQLNPAFSRWLQGYQVAWCQAAIRASRMRTIRRKRGLVGSGDTETR